MAELSPTVTVMREQGFPSGSVVKNPPATAVRSLGWEDPLEMEIAMATHSSILTWEIPRTKEPARQFIGLQRVGHDSE